MKATFLTILRDKNTTLAHFREASHQLASVLAVESGALLPQRPRSVETPLAMTTGTSISGEILLVPILRSGLALLPAFMQFHPAAAVGFIGARRDEATAIPHLYYTNLPPFNANHSILLLDPMLATGGSAVLATEVLKAAGAKEEQIILVSFVGSPQGTAHFQEACPKAQLIIAQIDDGLTPHQWISPGLGDFGDRYFGPDYRSSSESSSASFR